MEAAKEIMEKNLKFAPKHIKFINIDEYTVRVFEAKMFKMTEQLLKDGLPIELYNRKSFYVQEIETHNFYSGLKHNTMSSMEIKEDLKFGMNGDKKSNRVCCCNIF